MIEKKIFFEKKFILFLTICFIALFLRIYQINFDDLWFDELSSLWIAEPNITFKETIARNIELNKGPHLVFILILKYFFLMFGYNPDIARFVPMFFSIISVPALMYLVSIIKKDKSWLLVGFLVSINFYSISYSQEIRSYSLIFFLSIINLIFFIKILNNYKLISFIFYYLISLIGVCNHIFFFIIIFSQSIFIIFFFKNNKKKIIYFYLNVIVIFFSYLFIMYDSLLAQLLIKDFWIEPVKIDFFLNYYFSRFFGSKIMGAIYLIILIYLLWLNKKHILEYSNKLFLFLLLLINSYLLPLAYGFFKMPILTDRYIIFVLIPILILISILTLSLKNKKIMNSILFVIILSTLTNNYIEIFKRNNTKPEFKKSINYISNSKSENLILMDNENYVNKLIFNYLHLLNKNNHKIKIYNNNDTSIFEKVWVMCYLQVTNFKCSKPSYLTEKFTLEESKSFHLIKIQLYKRNI